ncbi:o-succinylbenzoate synthase [Pontibacillus salicampi]|uniref:o-succinylbenzoate synthase n=1 Tax=Pontibacillus salicampi TaxID=1449801 RepID=A0ABV6LNS2_9BACI
MKVSSIQLYRYELELVHPFQTHAGTVKKREGILVEVMDMEGRSGWGEGVAFSTPFYTGETVETSWTMLQEHFLPLLSANPVRHPSDIKDILSVFQQNQMAKASLDMAYWDLYAKQQQLPLASLIGGKREAIEVGVVLGLQDDISLLQQYKHEGYQRFKLKVEKGKERERIHQAMEYVPVHQLMFDGNGAYGEEELEHLQGLDDLGLMMIEQPFPAGDFYLHARLQSKMETPICLDESITSYHDVRQAIALNSCRIINVKIGRVGGISEAMLIYKLCASHRIPVWCGGMLETGVSRAHNIALASLDHFTIPGDISASKRYWHQDVITPEVEMRQGKVTVPTESGIGHNVNKQYLQQRSTDIYSYII